MKNPNTGRQRCTLCQNRSLPGILSGHGKCAYHFWAGTYWKGYADQLVSDGKIPPPVPNSRHLDANNHEAQS